MNVLIIGSGLLGRATAQRLDSLGHGVVVVDESSENLSLLDPDFGGATYVGFPMDLSVLRRAGIESCDAVVVATADDNLNIAVGQIAKKYFKIPWVAARIADPARENIFDGDVRTVCPTNMAAEKLASDLCNMGGAVESTQVTFGNATVSLEAYPVDRRYFGRTTKEVDLEKRGIFAVVKPDGRFLLVETIGDIPLSEGDVLVVSRRID